MAQINPLPTGIRKVPKPKDTPITQKPMNPDIAGIACKKAAYLKKISLAEVFSFFIFLHSFFGLVIIKDALLTIELKL
jgi:hypothetical protein